MATFDFTTGPSTLPDVGELSYNGCVFSPLFETSVNGLAIKDNANRTTKLMEYTITADGYVTLPDKFVANGDINPVMNNLRAMLTAQGGVLTYRGRGMNIIVNNPGATRQGVSSAKDVAWGPVPEVLDFQPMGAGRSAKIRWQVKTRIPEILPGAGFLGLGVVLQFNNETNVTYDDAGFSTLSIRGTLEIPLTRVTQGNRSVTQTVDQLREKYLGLIVGNGVVGVGGQGGIDLTRFRITRRDIAISRDKRTMEWDFAAEELPYMGLPPFVTIARGNFSFRPSKQGMGLCNWLCSLRVTYTVRKDKPRTRAWIAFLALLRVRMAASRDAVVPVIGANQNPGIISLVNQVSGVNNFGNVVNAILGEDLAALNRQIFQQQQNIAKNARSAWLIDLSCDEGMYLDSRTVTFSATWRLVTTFASILRASGLWRKVDTDGGNSWALSVQRISGWRSWQENLLDPQADVIVDFGSV